jgi:aryl-alcohol dehydrogenase-like predicted oxidoreductase
MDRMRLGRTGLMASRSGFGAIPIQRIGAAEAKTLLRKAYGGGIDFFDTARGYTDSEEKIGLALSDLREHVFLATKTPALDGKALRADLETSLRLLRTDYIDVYQLHNPAFVPRPGDGTGLYEALEEARRAGKVRFVGITNHRLAVAREALESGLYDTLQFPFSSLSSAEDLGLVEEARKKDVGFIAMKALSGGLLTNAAAAFAFVRGHEGVLPIWGIEREAQLDEFLALEADPPEFDDAMRELIERDRAELSGSFCRGCGYCLPCPAGIEINMAARMTYLMRRSRFELYVTPEWRAKMELIDSCTSCGSCRKKCPYGLDTPALLKSQLAGYRELAGQASGGAPPLARS